MSENTCGTTLRTALDLCDYVTAEHIIRATTETRWLNEPEEGYNLRIPLAYVLCKRRPNLFLAKVLAEMGADPNNRVEFLDWEGATSSPMEMLFNLIEYASSMTETDMKEQIVIGIQNQAELNPSKYREDLLELLDIFLARSGNPNVMTSKANATLFHIALAKENPNMEVVRRLCDAGGDLDQTNVHGTTAFMDLIKHAKCDLALTILTEIGTRQPDMTLKSLNAQNCRNETALWNACYAGSPKTALELLKRGANASFCNKSIVIPLGMELYASPLLASLLRDSYPHKTFASVNSKTIGTWNPSLMNKVIAHSISPLLDSLSTNVCFPIEAAANLKKLTTRLTKFKQIFKGEVNNREVPVVMFGGLSAGLEQLCVKAILQKVMTSDSKDQYHVDSLSRSLMKTLAVDELGLPPALTPRFHIEAARLQLGAALFKSKTCNYCTSGCEGLDDEEDSEELDAGSMFTATSDDGSIDWMDDWDTERSPTGWDNDDGGSGWETMSDESDLFGPSFGANW